MMGGSRNRCVIVAFVLAVSAGPAVKDATAGKKPKLVARVNNKGFRASLRASIVGAYFGVQVGASLSPKLRR